MHLINLNLQKSTSIYDAIYGNFSSSKAVEVIVSHGKSLELMRLGTDGVLAPILSTEIFGNIRSILPFRLTGAHKDYVIVGSDSGRIVILEYNPAKNRFDKIHQETFGKSGCRRIIPGQFLAADPKGRAVMIGSMEKQKLVYILNRDSAAKLTISSPLEAHKAHTILFSMVGMDVEFDNPVFACLEVNYEEEELQKYLTFYELDLGLNHVVRKDSIAVDNNSNRLVAVPGSGEGPGGVLVCAENKIYYRNQGNNGDIQCDIPKREGSDPLEKILIVSCTIVKKKGSFHFLMQNEYGDLFKVELDWAGKVAKSISISYYDTIPLSNALVHLKSCLFAAAEYGNHFVYQYTEESEEKYPFSPTFAPSPLSHLSIISSLDSLSPIMEMKVEDLARENSPQIYALSGRGFHSSLRVLRYGLLPNEVAESQLPGNAAAVWTVKTSAKEEFDSYIVVAFLNATLVLKIGQEVGEVEDSGMLTTSPSIHVANLGSDGFIQVHPNGIRHIRTENRINEWKTPGKKTIVHATSNGNQVVIALSGGNLFYFEVDALGNLNERHQKFIGREILCLSIAPLLPGSRLSKFVAVGDYDNKITVLSLVDSEPLSSLVFQTLPGRPESVVIAHMSGHSNDVNGTLFLNVGLQNGVLMRSAMDTQTGDLTDTRSRFLGARAVKLVRMRVKDTNAMMAFSSRTWLAYNDASTLRYQMIPLSTNALEHAATFTSSVCSDAIVAVTGNRLKVLSFERLDGFFNQTSLPLKYTPRHFIVHPQSNDLVIIESDHNATNESWIPPKDESKMEEGENSEDEEENNQVSQEEALLANRKPGKGRWASCIRLVSPVRNATLDVVELENNESAISLCTCVFKDRGNEVFLAVGTVKDAQLKPRSCSGGFIHLYKIVTDESGRKSKFQLVHKTPVESFPSALCPFNGRLLVGVGTFLRIYDMGKKKLLKKCEYKGLPNLVNSISTQGNRIYVSDIQESVHMVKYKKAENQLFVFADHSNPRCITSMAVLDYDTVAASDKFGNIMISRLPAQVSDDVEEDPTGSKLKMEQGYLNGAAHKLEDVAMFHVGETVNSIVRAPLSSGGAEALVYSTLAGSIGVLFPLNSREEIDFFSTLEMSMRQENPPLCGRDHLSYRSYYFPVKDVIDGELCEQYTGLENEKQNTIAANVDRNPLEVMKKLEDIRNRLM
eukprot:TRINITY_DN3484_c0_g1_i1.p1 TRINITY_DN3484_c0_g1~~TRINITY_DN3484_c0_g1_i1.p1  ORF type:complete len:1179 (-),score=412.47 TRINITY_DN3484_c0_g1_i1:140-3676(-)